MKNNLTQFLTESLGSFDIDKWISQHKGIPRNRMPQVDSDEIDYVLMHLARKYKLRKITIPVSKLRPIQNEINMDKVNKMVKKGKAAKGSYLVSKNWGIADGTHRIASLLMNSKDNNKQMVTVYKSNLDCRKLIHIMNKLKVTYHKEITESKTK